MKIFISTPGAGDGNSFWRCMGPMSYLANHGSDISIELAPSGQYAWDKLAQFDLVFMHRPCRNDDIKLLQLARTMNIPVWSDYDDWLFDLPKWNANGEFYHNRNIQTNIAACIALSDVVSVSTGVLQKEFSKLNPNVVILPNAYRDDLFPFRKEKAPPRNETYYWRGSNTHEGDLLSVMDGIRALEKPISFIGSPGYSALSQLRPEQVVNRHVFDTIRYWKGIYDLAGKVMICPLDGHYFNQSKSNIAWIEAVHAGSMIVAPDLPEWRHPGVITYPCNDSAGFLEACEWAMNRSESEMAESNHDAFVYMKSKFGIKTINQIRESLVNAIFAPTFERNKRDPFDGITGMWALSVMTGTPLPRAPGN